MDSFIIFPPPIRDFDAIMADMSYALLLNLDERQQLTDLIKEYATNYGCLVAEAAESMYRKVLKGYTFGDIVKYYKEVPQ